MKFKHDRNDDEFRLRRDAIRDAYVSARERRGGERADAGVLLEELDKRGIGDLSEDELDVLVLSLTSPNRAIAKRFSQKFGSVRQAVGLLRDLGTTEPPKWTLLFSGTPQIEWRADQAEILIERADLAVATTSDNH